MQAGFVYRDLRWPHVACTVRRAYFLLDLETCQRANEILDFIMCIWEDLLQDKKITKASASAHWVECCVVLMQCSST